MAKTRPIRSGFNDLERREATEEGFCNLKLVIFTLKKETSNQAGIFLVVRNLSVLFIIERNIGNPYGLNVKQTNNLWRIY